MKRLITILAMAISLSFVGTSRTLLGQTEDVSPPVLVSLSIAPSTIDATGGPATVTLTLHITDDISGFGYGEMQFMSPSGQVARGNVGLQPPQSGNANDGIYQSEVTIPEFAESGTWTLAYVDLNDRVGNRALIRTPELQAAGFPTTISVTSVPDMNSPVLADFSFTPTTVDVRNGPATFSLTLHITDDLSGFGYGEMQFMSPSGQVARGNVGLQPPQSGNANDGIYQSEITIPEFAESGTWTLAYVDLSDRVGNRALIRTPELQAAGFPTTLSVISVHDVRPPDLLSFSFAPSTIDVTGGPATVTLTLHITDDISGFGYGEMQFMSPSGQVARGNVGLQPPQSGNTNDGIYQSDLIIPEFAESGTWTLAYVDLSDRVGNRALIRTPELQAAGFPTELNVTGGPPMSETSIYLHGIGPSTNPPTLFLDGIAPTNTIAKFKDSTAINFSGGNPWKEVGVWPAEPSLTAGSLTMLRDLRVWLGLKNSDDQGTNFDLRVEASKNGALVAAGEINCIQGVTRNANLAKEVIVSFAPFGPVTFDGATDKLSLKVLTRIGSNGAGGFCGGHSNAVGLRLYFDSVSRPSRFSATIAP